MYTIGQIAKKFGFSRSTLLYYDSNGLLPISARTPSGYRLYSDSDCQLLERICSYREAGLSLSSIKKLLTGDSITVGILESRIHELNKGIEVLRLQQKQVVRLLLNFQVQELKAFVDNNAWNDIFKAAGFSLQDQWQWHHDFEQASPEKHQMFLESVGAPAEKIYAIRQWAQNDFEEKFITVITK